MRALDLVRPVLLRDSLQRVEAGFDRAFGPRANPWRHLGALGFLLFWIVGASGVYLYVVFDTSVQGAYASVQHLSREQWWFGGIVRSLHRYASDGFVLVLLLHLAREWIYGRHRAFRWFTWVSGVPLLWLALAAGVVGFWLVWDELAQFSAIATAEWLDWLGLFAEPLTRNFLRPDSVDDRLFSLLVFLHIGLPLLLLLGMWVHIKRLTHPDTRPSAALTWGTLAALTLLSVALPVQSGAPADLSRVPHALAIDWFYLAPNAAMYAWSPGALWLVAAGVTVLLVTLPWLPRARPQPVAKVDPANCNGCGRCFVDCPYAAITIEHRTTGTIEHRTIGTIEHRTTGTIEHRTTGTIEHRTTGTIEHRTTGTIEHRTTGTIESRTTGEPRVAGAIAARTDVKREPGLAVVDPALCASCGVCAGSCPSSTPFRSIAELVTGIDLPQLPIGQLRSRLKCQIARLKGEVKLVVFGCDHAADVRALQRADTATMGLLCSGQLPPAFVEYALRQGADGVVVTGCGECDCAFRLGNTWTEQRLRGQREPHLRRTVSPAELRVVWASAQQRDRLAHAVDAFRAELAARGRPAATDADHRYA
jgi:coenzyme F420-reducing hydrogenase delta subunit/Pyruvate/2-oxoacid:ferredoxin oxidoreductase delta subunit